MNYIGLIVLWDLGERPRDGCQLAGGSSYVASEG